MKEMTVINEARGYTIKIGDTQTPFLTGEEIDRLYLMIQDLRNLDYRYWGKPMSEWTSDEIK